MSTVDDHNADVHLGGNHQNVNSSPKAPSLMIVHAAKIPFRKSMQEWIPCPGADSSLSLFRQIPYTDRQPRDISAAFRTLDTAPYAV